MDLRLASGHSMTYCLLDVDTDWTQINILFVLYICMLCYNVSRFRVISSHCMQDKSFGFVFTWTTHSANVELSDPDTAKNEMKNKKGVVLNRIFALKERMNSEISALSQRQLMNLFECLLDQYQCLFIRLLCQTNGMNDLTTLGSHLL